MIFDANKSLFKNETALEQTFIPKVVPYRETQQHYIALCIRPLLQQRNGKNLFIYGPPGVGKTVACKHLFRELEETTELLVLYINCWQRNTSYKIILELCDLVGYKFTHNKKTEELFNVIRDILNKYCVVFAFDEIDKATELDFLYMIVEEIYRKSIILITNEREWLVTLDDRLRSRLTLSLLEFQPYNYEETKGILKQRVELAFLPNVFEQDAFELIVKKTTEVGDIRTGLFMLREAGLIAENKGANKIIVDYVKEAINRLDNFSVKDVSELEGEIRFILEIVKNNSGKKVGDLYQIYKNKGGELSYKSFRRKIDKLKISGFVSLVKTRGGAEGNITIVKYKAEKKLTDY